MGVGGGRWVKLVDSSNTTHGSYTIPSLRPIPVPPPRRPVQMHATKVTVGWLVGCNDG